MFDKRFDPYDLLIQLNERLMHLERQHNAMARDYQQTQRELNVALDSLQTLQRGHLALSELVGLSLLEKK